MSSESWTLLSMLLMKPFRKATVSVSEAFQPDFLKQRDNKGTTGDARGQGWIDQYLRSALLDWLVLRARMDVGVRGRAWQDL